MTTGLTNPNLPYVDLGAGIQTQWGMVLPPGARVAGYVRSTGPQDMDDFNVKSRLYLTLNAALAACRSGMGDYVIVLPGHAESIATADAMSNLVAGTNIVGVGTGTLRPTFTWTATASSFLFDVANTRLSGCILNLAGDPASTTALTVTAPITISAAGCAITGCQIMFCVDADQLSTIGITTTLAADDLLLAGLDMHAGTSDGTGVTTHIQFVGADRLKMYDCTLMGATSTVSVGVIRFLSTASLNIDVRRCLFANKKAASSHAVTGMTACTGFFMDCGVGVLDNSTLVFGNTLGSIQTIRCYTVNELAENGALSTVVSA